MTPLDLCDAVIKREQLKEKHELPDPNAVLAQMLKRAIKSLTDLADAYSQDGDPSLGPLQKYTGAHTAEIWSKALDVLDDMKTVLPP